MKRLSVSLSAIALGLSAVTGSAFAADMPLKAPPLPVWSWTGFYVGANFGYGWGRWDSDSISAIFPDGVTTTADPDVKGWFGGVTAGYNWQASQQWVLGVEGDFDWSGEKASDSSSASISVPGPNGGVFPGGTCDVRGGCTTTLTTMNANSWRKPWFGTLRARAGFLVDPTWLVYGTGGLAFARTEFATSSSSTLTIAQTLSGTVLSTTALPGSAFSESSDRVGFAVGAGVEKLLSQNWSVKGEYLFMDFGKHTFLSGTGDDTTIRLTENIIRFGVDYHFH